jgi:nicotinamidase/pyrazinamidase
MAAARYRISSRSLPGRQGMTERWGVIVTDIQGDFTEWKKGSLAVPGSGESYVRSAEEVSKRLSDMGIPVFGTQDWHPPNHISFATSHPGARPFETITINGRTQKLWPPHCVQGTENARILIDNNLFLAIVRKAQNPDVESYSAFQDERGARTEMDTVLKINNVQKVLIYGIATDYCVRATSLDGMHSGYSITVVEDLCRGVSPETGAAALDEMRRVGIRVVGTLNKIIGELG